VFPAWQCETPLFHARFLGNDGNFAPTAHKGRQLTTAFLKVESQLARRVIIELVEKPPLFPRLAGNIQAPPKTALTRLVIGVRVSFPGTIRFASA
jgi:hypothetical protein